MVLLFSFAFGSFPVQSNFSLRTTFYMDTFLLHTVSWSRRYQTSYTSAVHTQAPCKWTQLCWLTTPNIVGCYMLHPFTRLSFVPWSPKRSATMLDPFAQLFQHSRGHERALNMVFLESAKSSWVVSFPRSTAGPNIVGRCCIRLHTYIQKLYFSSSLRVALMN